MATLFFTTSLVLFVVLRSSEGANCPHAWTSDADSCYVIIQKLMNWYEAGFACKAVGGSLVEIESRAENVFLASLLQREHGSQAWMGLFDFLEESDFMWLTGQTEAEYTNWAPNEPNNDHDQDCGRIAANGEWDDMYCTSKHWSICERQGDEISPIG